MVRLLLSIDRRESREAALQTVALAAELQDQGVVGVDLSGNPTLGSWESWEPALREARRLGLKLTIHAGEVCSLLPAPHFSRAWTTFISHFNTNASLAQVKSSCGHLYWR